MDSRIEKPLTFEEWRGSVAPTMSDEMMKSVERLHSLDARKQFDEMLRREYNEYLDNFNGNWLLR
jgi:hypothetical protein